VIFAVDALVNKKFIGCVWLYSIDFRHRNAEVRIVIGEKTSWGTGVGKEVLRLLSDFARMEKQLRSCHVASGSENKGSVNN